MTNTAKIYSFRLHANTAGADDIQPIKGTREGIKKFMNSEPIEGSEEEVEATALDAGGFLRAKHNTKLSSQTS